MASRWRSGARCSSAAAASLRATATSRKAAALSRAAMACLRAAPASRRMACGMPFLFMRAVISTPRHLAQLLHQGSPVEPQVARGLLPVALGAVEGLADEAVFQLAEHGVEIHSLGR